MLRLVVGVSVVLLPWHPEHAHHGDDPGVGIECGALGEAKTRPGSAPGIDLGVNDDRSNCSTPTEEPTESRVSGALDEVRRAPVDAIQRPSSRLPRASPPPMASLGFRLAEFVFGVGDGNPGPGVPVARTDSHHRLVPNPRWCQQPAADT